MRVLHVFKTYLPDSFTGIERVIWEIAENTFPLGVTSTVLSVSPKAQPVEVVVDHHLSVRARQDIHIASTGLSLSLFSQFRKAAAQADIVHFHFPWPMMDLLQLMVGHGKPTVVTYHSDIVRQKNLFRLYEPLMHRFLESVDKIVATSPNYAATSAVLKRYSSKTSIIPIGIGESPKVDARRLVEMKRKVGENFFLFVGALRYYKGLAVLIEAAKLSGLPVVIAGKGEGETLIREAGLSNVVFLGPVDDADKLALLELCAAFVFPSHLRSEAFGVALLEAARAGRAMISCEIGTGTSYVNVSGSTGITIPPSDPSALGKAMSQLAQRPAMAITMGTQGRARYEHLFKSASMAASYRALYHSLSPV